MLCAEQAVAVTAEIAVDLAVKEATQMAVKAAAKGSDGSTSINKKCQQVSW